MSPSTNGQEIEPLEVKKRLDSGEKLLLVDVREPEELAICSISGALHIPMDEFVARLEELSGVKAKEFVIFCRSGHRSHHAAEYLRAKGFVAPLNMTGGILRWSEQVDPSLRKY